MVKSQLFKVACSGYRLSISQVHNLSSSVLAPPPNKACGRGRGRVRANTVSESYSQLPGSFSSVPSYPIPADPGDRSGDLFLAIAPDLFTSGCHNKTCFWQKTNTLELASLPLRSKLTYITPQHATFILVSLRGHLAAKGSYECF